MEYAIRIPESVKKDIEEIIEYYLDDSPEYALKLFELLKSYWKIIYRFDGSVVELFTVIDSGRNVQDLLVEKLQRNTLYHLFHY